MLIIIAIDGYSFSMRKKAVAATVIIIALILAGFLAFYLTRPTVAFITSDMFPEGYDIPGPGNVLRYRMTGNADTADIVITAPDASIPQGIGSYLLGRNAEADENPIAVLLIDEGRMWETALSDESSVLVYEESSLPAREISGHLKMIDPSLREVTYSGRISSVNIDQIRASIDESGAGRVLVLTPLTSMELLRSDHDWNIIMDIRDAAALETTKADGAVSIDWDASIDNLLSGISELSYRSVAL